MKSVSFKNLVLFINVMLWLVSDLGLFEIHFLTARVVKRHILHHCNTFPKDRSNRSEDIAIFVIFKMAAAAIVDFQKFETLTVGPL